jgi:hypothetical protein
MQCNIDKKSLHNIMHLILVECGLYVFGYDTQKDTFWGKQKDRLHFTIKIKSIEHQYSVLKFKIIMDLRNEMKTICEKIIEMTGIYHGHYLKGCY